MMPRLLGSLVLLCACGGSGAAAPPGGQAPLCTDLRAFAASKVSTDDPCPPESCTVSSGGVTCSVTPATPGEPDDKGAVRACTTFTADASCGTVCPPAQCVGDTSGAEVCDSGSQRCAESNSTCYVLGHASDCPSKK